MRKVGRLSLSGRFPGLGNIYRSWWRMNSGIGVEPVGADHGLALVGDMGRHPGDELQVVHPLELGPVVAVPVADLTPAESDQPRAKSTAAAAWRAVVSKTGMGLSAALINNGISVQPRMTPCAPRRLRPRMTST